MNLNSLRLPKDLIDRNGVKILIYGGAGTGKTRSVLTAPKPILFAVEQGLLSLQGEQVPVFDIRTGVTPQMNEAQRYDKMFANVVEFITFLERDLQAKQFETVYIDSISELASLVLASELPKAKDPRQAYGVMADTILKWVNQLHALPMNVVMLCKQEMVNSNNINYYQPAFDGQKLFKEITHKFDEIFRFQAKRFRMQQGFQEFMVCSTKNMQDYLARDKSGKLAEDEPQDIGAIIAKITAINSQ